MKKVFVALSGGVDSAVAAHKLKKDGWDVVGVFIRVWQPDFLPCSQDEEERAALRVAAHLGIQFKRLDLSKEYKRDVVDYMIAEYKKGRTPNPDVVCNASIKFGAFLKYALEQGADKIATGHHARVRQVDGSFQLLRGIDSSKDQAYFLWRLTQQELACTLMPIGELTKAQVREYADTHHMPSARKPDSQGLCFIGAVDMHTFLKNFIEESPGIVLDEEGKAIGTHSGIEFVTLGQRGGFTITSKEAHGSTYYVVAKDIKNNTLTVSTQKKDPRSSISEIQLSSVNEIVPFANGHRYVCEIRYHGDPIGCHVKSNNIVLLEEEVIVADGQSLVVYDKEVCVGGGIVG